MEDLPGPVSPEEMESPRKRLKLSQNTGSEMESTPGVIDASIAAHATRLQDGPVPPSKEEEVGITNYVSTEIPVFRGILKKRYTDFLVNEILPNGTVVHLQRLGTAAVSQKDENASSDATSKQEHKVGAQLAEPSTLSKNVSPPVTDTSFMKGKGENPPAKDQKVDDDHSPVGFPCHEIAQS
jgi:tRNA pseudouridine13 synthase